MSITVQVRDLKAQLSRYLARARAGEVLEVTSHRRVIARVTGVPDAASRGLAGLLASGAAVWRGGKPAGAEIHLSSGGISLADTVAQDRG